MKLSGSWSSTGRMAIFCEKDSEVKVKRGSVGFATFEDYDHPTRSRRANISYVDVDFP